MARGRRAALEEVGQELNLIPYLDIMTNLVIFMLVTITSFVSFTILNASIPQVEVEAKNVVSKPKGEELILMVRVKKDGYVVNANVQGGPSPKPEQIFKRDGGFDFEELRNQVASIKSRFPSETRVLLLSEPKVVYDDIIRTMDALRETKSGAGNLFPDVTLSIL